MTAPAKAKTVRSIDIEISIKLCPDHPGTGTNQVEPFILGNSNIINQDRTVIFARTARQALERDERISFLID